jgi:uncharacterized integral membrane protein
MSDDRERFDLDGVSDEPEVFDVDPRTGVPWGVILLFVGIALVVVFAVQNTNDVQVRFLWLDGEFPLSIVILVTAAVSILLGELLGVVYRSRRRRRVAEKDELRQFRDQAE